MEVEEDKESGRAVVIEFEYLTENNGRNNWPRSQNFIIATLPGQTMMLLTCPLAKLSLSSQIQEQLQAFWCFLSCGQSVAKVRG